RPSDQNALLSGHPQPPPQASIRKPNSAISSSREGVNEDSHEICPALEAVQALFHAFRPLGSALQSYLSECFQALSEEPYNCMAAILTGGQDVHVLEKFSLIKIRSKSKSSQHRVLCSLMARGTKMMFSVLGGSVALTGSSNLSMIKKNGLSFPKDRNVVEVGGAKYG
uniref:Uncharacterized protein n=1 Tax=Oryzias latipes TaxID=8090 RepID=A0A3P9LUR7_ORYLA